MVALASMVTTTVNKRPASGKLPERDASSRRVAGLGTVILSFLCLLASTSQPWADDYAIDFGVEVRGAEDTGSLRCRSNQGCGTNIDALGLRLSIILLPYDLGHAHIHLYGNDSSCCYFTGAKDSKTIDVDGKLSKIPFYRGVPARGALFIQNEYVGALYIRIRRP